MGWYREKKLDGTERAVLRLALVTMQSAEAAYNAMLMVYGDKYGIDFHTHQVNLDTGEITPKDK